MVASDRISTYDVVHPTPIPDKGKVLTGLSAFWFERTGDIVPEPRRLVHGRARRGPRPRDARRAARDVPGRVRRARLHHRLGLEGLPGDRRGLRDRAARRACASPSSCPSRSSRPPPRPRSATTTRTSTSTARPRSSATARCSRSCAGSRSRSTSSPPTHARERGIILADTKFEFGRARRRHDRARRRGAHARLVALLAGRRLRARPRPAVASTSSTCATGRPAPAGTRRRPRRRCPTTSSRARASSTSRRTSGSPASRSSAWLERCAREGARPDPAQGGDPRSAGPDRRAGAARRSASRAWPTSTSAGWSSSTWRTRRRCRRCASSCWRTR